MIKLQNEKDPKKILCLTKALMLFRIVCYESSKQMEFKNVQRMFFPNGSEDPNIIRSDINFIMKYLIELFKTSFDDESLYIIFSLMKDRYRTEVEREFR